MKNKTLLIVFLSLLALYGLNRFFSGKGDRNFDSALIKVDTAAVSTIVINLSQPEAQEISLKREDQNWIVSNGQLNVKALPEAVNSLLKNLSLLRTQQIAASNPDKWNFYEVAEAQGTQIKVYQGSQLIEDFIVGRFNFNPETGIAQGYIRLAGENEVYAVDGMQVMNFGQGFQAYRIHELIKMKREMIVNSFSCQFADTTLSFSKTNGQWLLNNSSLMDSMSIENYLNVLRNCSIENFADDFDETQASRAHYATLTLAGEHIPTPFVIDCFKDNQRQRPYVLHSNYNQETWFENDSAGVFKQLFLDVRSLLKKK